MYGSGRATAMSAPGLISRSRNSMEYGEIHYMNTVRDFLVVEADMWRLSAIIYQNG